MALLFFIMFALLAGSSFALMWANIKSISEMDRPIRERETEEMYRQRRKETKKDSKTKEMYKQRGTKRDEDR